MRSDPASPLHEGLEELLDTLFRGRVGKTARGIKSLRGIANHGLGLIDGQDIQIHEDLPQVVLGARGPGRPDGGPMIAAGFPDHALWP
jgi:hypothetical protein